jgi:large subunit ribosomal protein L10
MDRAQRTAEIERLTGNFRQSQIALCANYQGLTVAEMTELRRKLRTSGIKVGVVKNTLAKISVNAALKDADQAEREKMLKVLEGPNFVVFSDNDPISPTKAVTAFQTDHPKLVVKGAWFEGKCLSEAQVVELSKLPSREETLSKLLRLMQAPATQLVRLLQAPGSGTVRLIDAYRRKLEEGGKA